MTSCSNPPGTVFHNIIGWEPPQLDAISVEGSARYFKGMIVYTFRRGRRACSVSAPDVFSFLVVEDTDLGGVVTLA